MGAKSGGLRAAGSRVVSRARSTKLINVSNMQIGDEMHWRKIVSNYGHVAVYRVRVLKIGKRITVAVPQMGGGTRVAVVTPERLFTIPAFNQQSPTDQKP